VRMSPLHCSMPVPRRASASGTMAHEHTRK
jgi:hypothetical protein